MRKFLFLSVVLILTLISPIYAFADDLSEVVFTSDGQPATQEEIEQIDAEVRQTAQIIYNTLSDNGTRATPHDVNDVYNLLVQIFYNQSSGGNEIVVIRQMCTTINTSCNGIAVNTTSINNYIQAIYNSLNPDYDDTGISLYSLLHTFYDSVFDIDGSDGQLSIIEALVYIETELENVNTNLASIYSSILSGLYDLDQINVNIASILSGNNAFHGSMNTAMSNVNANLALIISNLQSFNNDFNNIVWSNSSTSPSYFSTLSDALNNTNPIDFSNPYISNVVYFRFSIPSNTLNQSCVIRLVSQLYFDYANFVQITQFNRQTSTFFDIPFYIDSYGDTSRLYLHLNGYNFNPIIFKITYNINSNFRILSPGSIQFINSNNIDFYYISNFLNSSYQNKIFTKFDMLYASDDLIAAKEDQQAYEDQAIQDFTGSGSAAASGANLGDLKSVSTTIKSGLRSGGSVSNALAPFNNNSGFWAWFSQSNYNDINNLSSTPSTRGGSSIEPEVIDFYSNNQYTLQGLLGGN